MTYCSQCDLVHGEEHRFCQVCGQLLKRSHTGIRPCARCNAPTLPGQKFCTDCGLPLRVAPAGRDETANSRSPVFYPRSSEGRSPRRRRRPLAALLVLVLLLGGAGVLVYGGYKLVSSKSSPKTQEQPGDKPKETLKPEVERLTEKIRAAHLQKDIHKWLGCYSPNYPQLGELEGRILEMWKNHDIKEVTIRIADVKRLGERQARVVVTLSFQLFDHSKQDYRLERQSYTLTLEKANGDWKIRESKVESGEPKS